MSTKKTTRKQKQNGSRTLATAMFPGPGKPSNASQVKVGMWLQGPPTKLTSQSSTGLVSAAITPSLSALTLASNWKAIYDEWRLLRIRFTLIPLGANGGCTKFIMDDEDATIPNASFAAERRGLLATNNSANHTSPIVLNYQSQDVDDLKFVGTVTSPSYTPMALKVYTDLSTYVTQPSTDLWLVSWEGFFEFRGIGAGN